MSAIPGLRWSGKLLRPGRPGASKHNYADRFRDENPGLPKDWQVHHSIPQKYRDLFADIGINVDENQFLRGVDRDTHTKITNEWRQFDRRLGGRRPSPQEIIQFARYIDSKFGKYFYR